MKTVPTSLQPLIDNDHWETFLLFQLGPNVNSQEFRYTTLPYDYTSVSLGKTFSTGALSEVDPPKVANSLSREAYQVILTDSDQQLRQYLDTWKMHGAPFKLYAGFIDGTGSPVDEYLTVYEGTVDTFSYTVTPDSEILLAIEGSSPVGALDLTRTLMTSARYLKQKYPGDTSYDQATVGSNEIDLLWGKEL